MGNAFTVMFDDIPRDAAAALVLSQNWDQKHVHLQLPVLHNPQCSSFTPSTQLLSLVFASVAMNSKLRS